ncbi:MAG: hypothetical protein NTU81_02375 [Candidatus Nomurabacteria bacterium]|nr:hypothetical protein [Candidatus Nomurabacteria bacterium]
MKNDEINFAQDIIYISENGEKITLKEIIRTKIITSVTISYLSSEKLGFINWIMVFLCFKNITQVIKELTIYDEFGITFYFTPGIESASICFSSRKSFDQLKKGEYNEGTIWKRYDPTLFKPYYINFSILNLVKLDWQD